MSSSFSFAITRWSAWAPGMRTYDDWERWARVPHRFEGPATPKVNFLPPMLRRRCSQLTRMCLEVAYRCLSVTELSSVSTVFASRNGESQTTQQLLQALATGDVLSPMAFSLSVHNSASGLFSIAAKNREASTAVAAGKSTFCYALLEAVGAINRKGNRQGNGKAEELTEELTMVVVGEELVADAYIDAVEYSRIPYAVSLLISKRDNRAGLDVHFAPAQLAVSQEDLFPQALMFIRWLILGDRDLEIQEQGHLWRFSKNNHNWRDLFGEEFSETP